MTSSPQLHNNEQPAQQTDSQELISSLFIITLVLIQFNCPFSVVTTTTAKKCMYLLKKYD